MYKEINLYLKEYSKDEEIIIWGAGVRTKDFLRYATVKVNKLIYDNDKNKAGRLLGEANEYKVELGEKICEKVEKDKWILIISNYDCEISERLVKLGYSNLLSLRMLQRKVETEQEIREGKIDICMLESTNFCNAKCTFCINPVMKRKKQHMTSEVFEKVIERLSKEKITPKIFRLHCSGEPLLDPQLFNKIEILKQKFPDSEVGYTTNFSIATDEIIDKILELKQDYITISLNAVDEKEYRSIMGLDFGQTISNVNRLIERKKELNGNIRIVLSAVVDDQNEKLIEQFKDMWKDKDISVRIMKKGEWVSEEEQETGDKFEKREYVSDFCHFLYKEICILSDGRYGLCCFDAEGKWEEVNIFNTSIIDSFKYKRAWRESFYLGKGFPAECKKCSFKR